MSGYVTTGDTAIPVPDLPVPDATPEAKPQDAPEPPDAGVPDVGTPEEEKRRRRRFFLLFLLLALLVLVIGLGIWYFLFRQPLPLPLPNTVQMPAYTTSIYGSTLPLGVAVSPNGDRIYVAETGGDRIVRIFDGAGNQVGTAVPAESTGTDHVPVWVAIDPITSSLYVSDRPTGSIYVYDRDGGYQRTLTLASPLPGWQPMGIAFDKAGNLYVTDLGGAAARVEEFDRSLSLVRTFGDEDRLSFPNGLAIDKAGDVLVADSNNGRLLAYKPDGTLLATVGRGTGVGELGLPRGLAVDGNDLIYVGDATAQGVLVFRLVTGTSPSLEYLGFFGGEGATDGKFAFPNGVATDGRGRVYVSDTSNNRVQMWSY